MNRNEKEANPDAPLVDHEYDGIQELNNPAPFWWQLFFYLSIAFGVGYYLYYEWGTGPSSTFELHQELTEIRKIQAKHSIRVPTDEEFAKIAVEPGAPEAGKKAYQINCASCHAADGGGLIGPNLTDRFWIHGKGRYADLFNVISAGVADKGMPAWGGILSKDDLLRVVVHVKNLQGSNPQVAKSPQGSEIRE
jgi:cytochrome c oxidase cbb3-type subunit 3